MSVSLASPPPSLHLSIRLFHSVPPPLSALLSFRLCSPLWLIKEKSVMRPLPLCLSSSPSLLFLSSPISSFSLHLWVCVCDSDCACDMCFCLLVKSQRSARELMMKTSAGHGMKAQIFFFFFFNFQCFVFYFVPLPHGPNVLVLLLLLLLWGLSLFGLNVLCASVTIVILACLQTHINTHIHATEAGRTSMHRKSYFKGKNRRGKTGYEKKTGLLESA